MCPRQGNGVNYTGLCIPSIARIIFSGKSDGKFEELSSEKGGMKDAER